jgi:predicted metal-dependent hydrolase
MQGSVAYSVHNLAYRVQFSGRRTLAISVKPDSSIEIVAPKGTSQEEIEKRLKKRARWVIRQFLYFDQFRPRSPERRYVGGETHLYLGRQYRLKIVEVAQQDVQVKGGRLIVRAPSRSSLGVKRTLGAWYRKKGEERLRNRFDAILPKFVRPGCEPPKLIVRSMSRRWGSFTRTGRILLNPDLIRAPSACIDYVITHELAHLAHRNHGTAFYELLEAVMPDWRQRKRRLERCLS